MDDYNLIVTYAEFNTPVDQFTGNDDLAVQFIQVLEARMSESGLDSHEVLQRLLYLRKRGRLPRLRRNYYGRKPSDN